MVAIFVFFRGLSAPEAEMLYMQEVEKMEGYGQESYQAKVGFRGPARNPRNAQHDQRTVG